MPGSQPKKQRISVVTAICMVALAVIFDGIQDILLFINVLPVIGQVIDVVFSWFISFLAAVSFGVWFALLRVNYFSGRKSGQKLLVMFSSIIVELIPYIDALPAITFGVVSLIIITRIEDAGMTGAGILQTVAGTAQVAGAVGLRGSNRATRGVAAARERENSPLSEAQQRGQFLNLRPSRPQRQPKAGTDTPTN